MSPCPICKGNIIRRRIQYNLLGENLGIFPAEICQKCKEQFFSKEISLVIEKIAKEKGLWDLKSKTKVNQVGNSLSIRIDKKLSNFLKLKKGQEIIIQPESKDILTVRKI